MDALEMDNPSTSITEDCQISSSQREILSHCPFPEDPFNSPGDVVPPTLPATAQDAGDDMGSRHISITPPEKQSSTFDFRPCTRHKAVQTDAETQDFDDFTGNTGACVDLSDDLDLGSPLAKLIHMAEHTMVAGCSRGKDVPSSNCEIDKFEVWCRELSPKDSIGESPHKRMKTSEKIPGSGSSQACFEIEPQKIIDNLESCEGNCNFAADPLPQANIQIGNEMPLGVSNKKKDFSRISIEKNLGSSENLGSHINQSEIARSVEECGENIENRGRNCEDEKLECTNKGNNPVDEIGEQQKLRIVSPSILACLKDIAKRKNENGEDFNLVFDVFKCLTQEDSTKKDGLDNVSWLELAKSKGITFPTPRWRKETNN